MTNDSEEFLIHRAREALSGCNWELGLCASTWTKRYAKGRTDAAFGELVGGLSAEQVYQRRRVWETFGDVRGEYHKLVWSHFYAALTWDNAAECLGWAQEMQATVAEMRAWRRAQMGEDLSVPEQEEAFALADSQPSTSNSQPVHADDVDESARRESGYAPFNNTARGPARETHPEADSEELIYKRITVNLEKCIQALSPDLIEAFPNLPHKLQQRVTAAIDQLQSISTMFEMRIS